jgi:hypothetical protein
MGITVQTAATERRLTTVAAVQNELPVSVSPDKIDRRILAASAAIERFCDRIFARQTYVETINGDNSDTLMVTHTPIIGTPTVVSEGLAITDFEVSDAEAGWLFRETGWARGAWVEWNVESTLIDSRYPQYSVTYEAGYKLPGERDTDLPADIQEACIITVVQMIKRMQRDLDIKSKKVGDLSLTYGGSTDQAGIDEGAIPPMARALLPVRLV